jgi:hypothetical protein
MFDDWIYAVAFAFQALFYGLAAYGAWSEYRSRRADAYATTAEATR